MVHKTSRTERSLKAMDVSPEKYYWWRHFIPWKIGNWLQKKVNVKGFKEKLMDLWIDKSIYKKKNIEIFFFTEFPYSMGILRQRHQPSDS